MDVEPLVRIDLLECHPLFDMLPRTTNWRVLLDVRLGLRGCEATMLQALGVS